MRLTPTQRFILLVAAKHPIVQFGAGDRKGTRVVGHTDTGVPVIVAYQTPEYFMLRRKLLMRANAPHQYQITDTGRKAAHL